MGKSTLGKDEQLNPGASLESDNGQFRADMQTDGNFVVYEGDKPVWASNSRPKRAGCVKMQADGNLVVYDDRKYPHWSSATYRETPYSSVTLKLTDEGKLVITTESGQLWTSD